MQTATKPQHLDMLNGPIWNKLPRYALPVAATGILQHGLHTDKIGMSRAP